MHIIEHRMVGFRFFINFDMDVYWHSKKTAKMNNLGFYKKVLPTRSAWNLLLCTKDRRINI